MTTAHAHIRFLAGAMMSLASSAAAQGREYHTVAGTVRDTTGAPVAGAEVFVGLDRVADPRAPGGCEDRSGRLLGAARTVTDAAGRYQVAIPVGEEDSVANCVIVWAALRAGVEPWGERPLAHALWQAVPLAARGVTVDLVLTPLPPQRTTGGRRESRFPRRPDDDWADAARGACPVSPASFSRDATLSCT
ncbi:MAG: carboxypeptidase-like regulatory domain-containing protein [Gemmatimonadaceae bacterium]